MVANFANCCLSDLDFAYLVIVSIRTVDRFCVNRILIQAHEFLKNLKWVHVKRTLLKRSALPITETEDKLIAAAASIGESNVPNTG